MKATTLLYALLAAPATAQLHAGHGHARFHEKRDLVTEYETEYVTEYVTEYIDETTTVFFYPDATTSSTSGTEASSSSTGVAGQFFEGSTTTLAVVPVETPTPVVVPTPPATTLVPVVPETTTSEEPVYTPPPVETTTTTPTPTPTTEAAAPATTSADTGAGNSSGETYSGDMTYYTVGMGACGEDDSGKDDSENIVALSHELMGTQSNGNPYCGRTITISYNGKTTTAICKDKCMGCGFDEIDVSSKAFLDIFGDLGVGRHTVDWWFSD